ncbi:dihydropteroate synthase [Halioxenophilus sp. WMMB6]|uniref:dihydropteroate synthase n=1 Tax=Halioxenophilus sp. WMMB6 TaxID=3073815 RepID=UPI00295E2788|nr:dihydropteroate synthase [Halioxenophilus sp. WMMB6]
MDEQILTCGDLSLSLLTPKVMGVLNVTPDSFSDGGSYHKSSGELDLKLVLQRVQIMLDEGAEIIDVGGESTRPGAAQVGIEEELKRVVPVVAAIRKQFDVVVSVDTSSPAVIRQAADHGAGLINDVRALMVDGALNAAVDSRLPVCLMHMQGQPQSMQSSPSYSDIVAEVYDFLSQRLAACTAAGIDRQQILLDPGFGFGKSRAHNLTLVNELHRFTTLECPLLVGFSRKSTVGEILNKPVNERVYGSLALAYEALRQGAKILRVHDVAATVDIVKIHNALEDNRIGEEWYES